MNHPVSIVIPCYNEEASVAEVMLEFADVLSAAGQQFEFIVIDDGSTDATTQTVEQSGVPVRLIRHRTNRGYGSSVKAGIRAASHDYVVIVDADGQHSPQDLVAMLEYAEEHDMVVGARSGQASHHWRLPGKFVLKLVCDLLVGMRIPDVNSGFRVLKKGEALKLIHLCSDQFSFSTTVTLAFLSDRLSVHFVPVKVRPRRVGKSQVWIGTGFSTFMLILRTIGTFNPLKIFMPPTVVLFFIGLAMTVEGLLRSNVGDVAILFLITSFILFCFGLLADQIALLRRQISKS